MAVSWPPSSTSHGSNSGGNGDAIHIPHGDLDDLPANFTYELTDAERAFEAILENKLTLGASRPSPHARTHGDHTTAATGGSAGTATGGGSTGRGGSGHGSSLLVNESLTSLISYPASISGIDEFTTSCMQLRLAPSHKVIKQLSTTELRLAHYGLGPTGATAVAAALRVR